MSELLEKIRSRGHWRAVIHPATFDAQRIAELSALRPILEKSAVRFKGWDFPHVDSFINIDEGADWIGQEIDWEPIVELWRFYQSGQFVHYSGMMTDWNKRYATFTGWPSQWYSGARHARQVLLDIKEVIIRFAEIYELASRLTFTAAGAEQMHLEIDVSGIGEYLLRTAPKNQAAFFREMATQSPQFSFTVELPQIELMSNTRELALKPAAQLFQQFDWNPGIPFLRDIQYELLSSSPAKAPWL